MFTNYFNFYVIEIILDVEDKHVIINGEEFQFTGTADLKPSNASGFLKQDNLIFRCSSLTTTVPIQITVDDENLTFSVTPSPSEKGTHTFKLEAELPASDIGWPGFPSPFDQTVSTTFDITFYSYEGTF